MFGDMEGMMAKLKEAQAKIEETKFSLLTTIRTISFIINHLLTPQSDNMDSHCLNNTCHLLLYPAIIKVPFPTLTSTLVFSPTPLKNSQHLP